MPKNLKIALVYFGLAISVLAGITLIRQNLFGQGLEDAHKQGFMNWQNSLIVVGLGGVSLKVLLDHKGRS